MYLTHGCKNGEWKEFGPVVAGRFITFGAVLCGTRTHFTFFLFSFTFLLVCTVYSVHTSLGLVLGSHGGIKCCLIEGTCRPVIKVEKTQEKSNFLSNKTEEEDEIICRKNWIHCGREDCEHQTGQGRAIKKIIDASVSGMQWQIKTTQRGISPRPPTTATLLHNSDSLKEKERVTSSTCSSSV